MFDAAGIMRWDHVDGIHSFEFNSVTSPLNDFDVQVEQRIDTSRNKMMAHGLWRTRSYRAGMSIHMEGTLFGDQGVTDEITSENYVTNRQEMILALFGDPDDVIVDDYMGSLSLTPSGETEAWVAQYCVVEAFQAPVQALYPALTPYIVTFHSFDPWFIGYYSDRKHMWS